MSVTAHDILACAKQLSAEDLTEEVKRRNVVGRAYHSAYHNCHEFHKALPAPGCLTTQNKIGPHEELIMRLGTPAPEVKGELNMKSRKRSAMLRALRDQRTDADYHIDIAIPAERAAKSVADAQAIFNIQ